MADKYTWNRWYGGALKEHPQMSAGGLPADLHGAMLPTSIPATMHNAGFDPADPGPYSPYLIETESAHRDGANHVHGPSDGQIADYERQAMKGHGLANTIRDSVKSGAVKNRDKKGTQKTPAKK